jgi:hypothetical protein
MSISGARGGRPSLPVLRTALSAEVRVFLKYAICSFPSLVDSDIHLLPKQTLVYCYKAEHTKDIKPKLFSCILLNFRHTEKCFKEKLQILMRSSMYVRWGGFGNSIKFDLNFM